jgi:putative flippase GtrA
VIASGAPTGATDPRRLARYVTSGALAATVHLGALTLLVELGDHPPVVATVVGFIAGLGVSYGLQRSWVFDHRGRHLVQLPRFLTVTAAAFAVNVAVVHVGVTVLEVHYAATQFAALTLVPINNYVLNSLWTFR